MIKHKLIILLVILQSAFVLAQSPALEKLNAEVEKLKSDKVLQHASWSFCVMHTTKDAIIAEYNSQQSLIPASTLKLLTTGAALSMFGSEYKFKTKLEYDGTFDTVTGTITGNVYITGGGDPTLDSKYFKDPSDTISTADKWAILLKNKGVNKVEGAIIGDASIFEENTIPDNWIWVDMGNYFGAGASGLTYHDNSYSVSFKSGNIGSTAEIYKTEPYIEGLQIINRVISAGKTDSAYIYGAPYSYVRTIEGSIPPNRNDFIVEGSIPDPALFCAQSLEKSLKKAGINISKKATTVRILKEAGKYAASTKRTLHTHYSPTLEKIVYWTNTKSINLYAEHLLKFIAYAKTGIGTETKGIELIRKFYSDRGVDLSGFVMTDGCGLSRANVITTKTQAQALRKMYLDKSFNAFFNSLPISGKPGTLSSIGIGTFAENNMRAKSGYIAGVRGYTGYVKNKKGETLCFSILVNNFECTPTEVRKKMEKIMVVIPELE
jgi:D-alanyl-D-alanine carboxypeptidase/D-alanyl-D-alanine-endopeptidase (penicillin-binding protein 4)